MDLLLLRSIGNFFSDHGRCCVTLTEVVVVLLSIGMFLFSCSILAVCIDRVTYISLLDSPLNSATTFVLFIVQIYNGSMEHRVKFGVCTTVKEKKYRDIN